MKKLIILPFLVLFLYANEKFVTEKGVEYCLNCHKVMYNDWSKSMHAFSEKDPLVQKFYEIYKSKNLPIEDCKKCHSPLQAEFKNDTLDGRVLCIFCHSIKGVKDKSKFGIDYYHYEFSDYFRGPYGSIEKEGHKSAKTKIFREIDICSGCHRVDKKKFNQNYLCQKCHMPYQKNSLIADNGNVKRTIYRHKFEGGHSIDQLRGAMSVDVNIETTNSTTELLVTVENEAAHEIPFGFAFREIYLIVKGYDENEKVVWTSLKKSAYIEDKQAYFGNTYKDEDLLEAHSKKLKPLENLRLQVNAKRELKYSIPNTKIAYIKVEGFYNLVSKTVLEKLNIEQSLSETKMILSEEFEVE